MVHANYSAQVALLIQILPSVAKEECFALKGGTAINLFYRDLPRLSVDIDLTFLPLTGREEALEQINAAMERLAVSIGKLPGMSTERISGGGGHATRVLVRKAGVTVKIETTPVTRGVVFDPELKRVSKTVERQFGFAEMQLASFEDIYGGKICAALDRQHPRDLYDIDQLYKNEGLTDDLFRAFLIYAASSSRPLCELLDPRLKDLTEAYKKQFAGMTKEAVKLQTLYDARDTLIADIQSRLRRKTAEFLTGLQQGEPDFTLIDLPDAADLPAIRWKLLNVAKFKQSNPEKFKEQTDSLMALLIPNRDSP